MSISVGPLNHCHTQLNVCEKEELQCFLYLIQIFGRYQATIFTEKNKGPRKLGIVWPFVLKILIF